MYTNTKIIKLKGREVGEMVQKLKHLHSMRPWIQIPRIRVKVAVITHICNLSAPIRRKEARKGNPQKRTG